MAKRKLAEKTTLKKWQVVEEEEVNKYSGFKGFILFILFPPLALFGGTKKIKVTYEK